MDGQRQLATLERLERRRGETWQGLWLAPLATLVAQAFLLAVLADEAIGWLARVAVLAAALAAGLAAIWSVLRAHAREVQYTEAIAELADEDGDPYPDVRPSALSRPRRRRPATPKAAAAPADTAAPLGAEPEPAPDPEPTPEPDLDPVYVEVESDETSFEEPESEELDELESDEIELEAETELTPGPRVERDTEVFDTLSANPPTPPPTPPPPPRSSAAKSDEEDWVARWDRHLTWWAAGDSHAKAYMGWTATLALVMVADVAVFLATV